MDLLQRHIRLRRYALVRTVASLTGDFATGMAFGSLCSWIISAASLGTFLSFLAWVIAVMLALLVSQHIVHPGVKFLLSDAKLDDATAALQRIGRALAQTVGRDSPTGDFWQAAQRHAAALRDRLRPS